MKQIISKDGQVFCTTSIPYPPEVIKGMKKAGFKVKEITEKPEKKEK